MTTDWQIDEALAAARDLEIERELMERAARAEPEASRPRCGRCAWCLQDHKPRRRGYELVCSHGFGCCQNCTESHNPYVEVADANPERVNNGCAIYKAN